MALLGVIDVFFKNVGFERHKMEELKQNTIRFEMTPFAKFVYYKSPAIGGFWFSGFLYVVLTIMELTGKRHYSLTEALVSAVYLPVFISIMCFLMVWQLHQFRLASELNIDRENNQIRAYIYASKKEVVFTADDIKEIGNNSTMLRFFLKDGTYVSWLKDNTTQQSLDDIIKSFGISIKEMNFT